MKLKTKNQTKERGRKELKEMLKSKKRNNTSCPSRNNRSVNNFSNNKH